MAEVAFGKQLVVHADVALVVGRGEQEAARLARAVRLGELELRVKRQV